MNRKIQSCCLVAVVVFSVLLVLSMSVHLFKRSNLYRNIELSAVKGVQYCAAGSEGVEPYHGNTHECLLGTTVPSVQGVTIVTFVNQDWLPMAHNWLCSLQALGLGEGVLVVAFGDAVCKELGPVACYSVNATYGASRYGERGYQQMLLHRTRVLVRLLQCGSTLLVTDVDVAFLRNPLPRLALLARSKDALFQGDSIDHALVDRLLPYLGLYACMGFLYLKPTPPSLALMRGILGYQEHHHWNDQAALNVCLRHPRIRSRLDWALLDYGMFPNGIVTFKQHGRHDDAFIVHANFLLGMNNKMAELMAAGLWCDRKAFSKYCPILYNYGCRSSRQPKSWCPTLQMECTRNRVDIS